MTEVEVLEHAEGPCCVCGKDSAGSFYWTPLPQKIWAQVRHILIQNVYFIPPYSKPFCSPECSLKWYQDKALDNMKRGEG